eukprot:TRINITY_DN16921_c0_g2_i3.p1 TRINITY_DN16921_c0_g2~~TRINITY_DN16921_c0_g2_i3.p1  ORF type:complete len:393 (+),score=90.69 TRINITY_DN16921_c0_g2_i3:186-1364(+)
MLLIFEDCSMHNYRGLKNEALTQHEAKFITELRRIEKLTFGEAETGLDKTIEGIDYKIYFDKEAASKSFAVAFTGYDVQLKAVWKFPNKIRELKFSPSSPNLFALVSKDPFVKILNFAEKRYEHIHRSYYGNVLCLDYSADGKLLAVGAEDDSITVYDTAVNAAICRCTGHRSFVSSIHFDSMNKSGSGLNNMEETTQTEIEQGLKHINTNYKLLNENELLAAVKKSHATKLHPNPNSSYRLITAGHDCMICVWELDLRLIEDYNHFQRSRLQRRSVLLKEKGYDNDENPFISYPATKDYPCLGTIQEFTEPLIKEMVHKYPIVRMETVMSFIFTISQSGNCRIFKPTKEVRKILVEDIIEDSSGVDFKQLELKSSPFKTKKELDRLFAFKK